MVEKRHLITVAGRPGSGKSTVSKIVAEQLGYSQYSSGDRFREMVAELGFDIRSGTKHADTDQTLDRRLDEEVREVGKNDNQVIDSRMAWHWFPESFKVYLDLDIAIAAIRIISKKESEAKRHKSEYVPDDPVEYANHLQERLDSEIARYANLYDVYPYDTTNYDLVIDTQVNDPDQVAKLIIDNYDTWLKS